MEPSRKISIENSMENFADEALHEYLEFVDKAVKVLEVKFA